MLCVVLCLTTATPSLADPVELPLCGTDEASDRGECRCPVGTVTCLDRVESVRAVVMRHELDVCTGDLAACRALAAKPPPERVDGWDPWTTVAVTTGIVLTVGALAFGGGYLLARETTD